MLGLSKRPVSSNDFVCSFNYVITTCLTSEDNHVDNQRDKQLQVLTLILSKWVRVRTFLLIKINLIKTMFIKLQVKYGSE